MERVTFFGEDLPGRMVKAYSYIESELDIIKGQLLALRNIEDEVIEQVAVSHITDMWSRVKEKKLIKTRPSFWVSKKTDGIEITIVWSQLEI